MTNSIADSDLPPLILVVSDLHLLTGCDPVTGRMHPRDNFLADSAFARFLAAQRRLVPDGAPLLVINGDSLDFIRITDIPTTDEDFAEWEADLARIGYHPKRPLRHTLVRKEYRYGLRTDDYKTVWKFREIVRGHPVFFAALGEWVRSGGRLVFLKGNHDLEFHWTLLHQAIREELAKQAGDLARGPAIQFHEDWYQIHNVYIEHGHRFEPMTRVDGEPTIFRGDEVRFPFGSFFNKYVINELEGLDPFLDNIKPTSKVLQVAIRRRPLSAFAILYHGARALRRVIFRERAEHWLLLLLVLVVIALPILIGLTLILAFIFKPVGDQVWSAISGQHPVVRALVILAAVAPWLIAIFHDLSRKRKYAHAEDEYGEGIYEALRGRTGSFELVYGIVGHTHRMDVQDLGMIDGVHCIYLNSGSWTPRWDEHRPDLNGRIEYSFISLDLQNGEYRHRMLEWRDDRGEGAPAVIYGSTETLNWRPKFRSARAVSAGDGGRAGHQAAPSDGRRKPAGVH
jgi:UDP-2,3-diacylglucosamine pyrophosphatase LpxH